MKFRVSNRVSQPMSGVSLTGGVFQRMFENNIGFLKGFDLDRILYWYRVHKGKKSPGVPYAFGDGHFENNLKGQTAGEFLMGACTSLLWKEDKALRDMADAIVDEIAQCKDDDGFLIPITRDEFKTREYPNYTRAWITFGLLDAGFAGNEKAFSLARGMSDWFNRSEVLPYVKDMNLGFQGILACTRVYTSPIGKKEDIDTALMYYKEDWWLDQLIKGDHRAIYEHPGNHPHSTLLTTLEGYHDIFRATGDPKYLTAVKSALHMYEDKWQHVGGGISMCENDRYFPGCNWLSPNHNYNELCSTNFWVLLNQRMHLLEPDNAHYMDEIESSLYNVLLASQVSDRGYHYLNFLEKHKDMRWLDRATCCASLGTRLAGLLPQFLYSYAEDEVYINLYAQSEAALENGVKLSVHTDMPENGRVLVKIHNCDRPFTLYLRHPRWACEDGKSFYIKKENVRAGDIFEMEFPFIMKGVKYTGAEQIYGKERWALMRGPMLFACMGAPAPLTVTWDPENPEMWFEPVKGKWDRLSLRGDEMHEYRAYASIEDEPFSVYPVLLRP
ncbi:MAG: glycoside hydrolase family 127 protein [Clostridia bacterium]|nr:glycoside hydrolase family 127 protein [Clostridia bacterium]